MSRILSICSRTELELRHLEVLCTFRGRNSAPVNSNNPTNTDFSTYILIEVIFTCFVDFAYL